MPKNCVHNGRDRGGNGNGNGNGSSSGSGSGEILRRAVRCGCAGDLLPEFDGVIGGETVAGG